jgi:DNA-binding protein YbaB
MLKMFDKMKQLMEMKKQAEALKKQLDASSIDVSKVDGIRIRINGSQQFQAIEIGADQLKPENKQRFEADLLKSLNAAIAQSQQLAAQKMKETMPGMPGF